MYYIKMTSRSKIMDPIVVFLRKKTFSNHMLFWNHETEDYFLWPKVKNILCKRYRRPKTIKLIFCLEGSDNVLRNHICLESEIKYFLIIHFLNKCNFKAGFYLLLCSFSVSAVQKLSIKDPVLWKTIELISHNSSRDRFLADIFLYFCSFLSRIRTNTNDKLHHLFSW